MSVQRREFLKGLIGVSLLPELAPADWLKTHASRRPLRDIIDVTGPWKMQLDPYDEGSKVQYFAPHFNRENWTTVSIPCTFNQSLPGMDGYRGICWFSRSFQLPIEFAGRPVFLCFQGVNYYTTVWVNGMKLIENKDPFLPFEAALPPDVRPGILSNVTVRVDSLRAKGELPTFEGWFPDGGILREVWLEARPALQMSTVNSTALLRNGGGDFSLTVSVSNLSDSSARASIRVKVRNPEGGEAAALVSKAVDIPAGQTTQLNVAQFLPNALGWSPDSPALHTADITLLKDGQEMDQWQQKFGFRSIEIREGGLWLNGQRLFLTGFNRHEDSPRTGMAMDLGQARKDFQDMKQAGCNFVRLCHYPHHPGELELCDELGLLVLSEIPLNGWGVSGANGSYGWHPDELPSIREAAERQLRKMITRDVNHPSIIFWSVCNEPLETQPEIRETNNWLIKLARRLDPTRLVTHVSASWLEAKEIQMFEFDDVISINQYYGHKRLEDPGFDFNQATEWLREKLEQLQSWYPGKPILVTEFGYPCLAGIDGPIGEDVQAAAFEAEFRALAAPLVCGATVWCFAKHPWPPGGYFKVLFNTSPYGFVSRDRSRKLKAFDAAARLFKERQAQKS